MKLTELNKKIEERKAHLAVIGLGYVGLPVACTFAKAGFKVTGLDIKSERVTLINSGKSPIEGDEPGFSELLEEAVQSGRFIATSNYQDIASADIVLISVETPVDENHNPNYTALRSACVMLTQVLKDGALVIIESTVAPGTTTSLIQLTLEDAGSKQLNKEFYLGVCPERVMPGKLLLNLHTMNRVCGGSTPETAATMVRLYNNIVDAELDPTDLLTAELVKTTENAYRDVQIAFANEVALICEAIGGDIWRVRELVNKSPYRQMHLPGAGVGGHCIPKDPWLLVNNARHQDVPIRLIPAARAINDTMPAHILQLVEDGLKEAGRSISDSRILILGYAYLENSDDTRNSPSERLIKLIQGTGAEPIIHDPFVAPYQGGIMEKATGCDAVVLMVRHSAYLELDLQKLKSILLTPVFIDGRNAYPPDDIITAGFIYRAVGRSPLSTKTGE